MTICPGRKGSSASGGTWDRDFDADLEAIEMWGPDLVLTLLGEHEVERLGIPDLAARASRTDLRWVFAPIDDGKTPDAAFSETWETLGPRVRNILRRGGRVLIHCRAGLGRTGMLAASLLVELGQSPTDAIEAVRSARPGTIENAAQEAYVRSRIALKKPGDRASHIRGAIFGAAIGDALSAPFQGLETARVHAILGEEFAWRFWPAIPGGSLRPRAPGSPTELTASALTLAKAIAMSARPDKNDFAEALGSKGRALRALLEDAKLASATDSLGMANDLDSSGVVRAHVVAALEDRDEVQEVSERQARGTCSDPLAIGAAAAMALLVHDAIAGLEPTLEPPDGVEGEDDDDEFIDMWWHLHGLGSSDPAHLSATIASLRLTAPAAVIVAHVITYVYRHEPQRAIAYAAALGKDMGPIAVMVGAIVGARIGFTDLCDEWTWTLRQADLIGHVSDLLVIRTEDAWSKDLILDLAFSPEVKYHDGSRVMFEGRERDGISLIGTFDVDRLLEATQLFRKMNPDIAVTVESCPTAQNVLNFSIARSEVIPLLDFGLHEALVELGLSREASEKIEPMGGSGSEYRGFLIEVQEVAERYILAQSRKGESHDSETTRKLKIADEVIFVTRSVAFATRYDYQPLGFTAAGAVDSLAHLLPRLNERIRAMKVARNLAVEYF